MPPADESTAIVRVVLTHKVGRGIQRNVFHVHSATGEWPEEFLREVADCFFQWGQTGLLGAPAPTVFQSESASWLTLALLHVGAPSLLGLAIHIGAELGLFGPVGQLGTAANSTIALQWHTARGGRRGRGRTYLCGLTRDLYEESDATTIRREAAGAIIECYEALRLGLATWGGSLDLFQLSVFHRDGLGVDPDGGRWYTPIVGCRFADLTLDSQKGRLPGHVHH